MPHAPSQDVRTARRLRRGIGFVGILLPIAITVGNAIIDGKLSLLGSLSGAYYTGMRDVWVGSIVAIGIFLIAYRHAPIDDALSNIAGVAALAVALFPAKQINHDMPQSEKIIGIVHLASATLLFLIMAIFCFFVFTRPDIRMSKSDLPQSKRARNGLYVLSGWVLILALAAGAAGSLFLPHDIAVTIQPMFWGEAFAVWAFGFAWLVKGDAIVRDDTGEDIVPTKNQQIPAGV
jgi:hypothetical protein